MHASLYISLCKVKCEMSAKDTYYTVEKARVLCKESRQFLALARTSGQLVEVPRSTLHPHEISDREFNAKQYAYAI